MAEAERPGFFVASAIWLIFPIDIRLKFRKTSGRAYLEAEHSLLTWRFGNLVILCGFSCEIAIELES